MRCCISFDSYIKPQRSPIVAYYHSVVYLLTPTSNHNIRQPFNYRIKLYIFWLLHQTTTCTDNCIWRESCISFDSYIKPQRHIVVLHSCSRCISFDSYIKPQPERAVGAFENVVYLLTPTSNHNRRLRSIAHRQVVYLLTPTSNHNFCYIHSLSRYVVYLLTPTSNHNLFTL